MTVHSISVSAEHCFGKSPLTLNDLAKVNFIFAPNGSGKTTVSSALAAQPVERDERLNWSVAKTEFPIRVFNEAYRAQVLRERVDGIFTIGSGSAEIIQQIEEVEAAKKARKLDRETWQDEIGGPDSPSQAGLIGSLAEEWVIAREDVYAIYREIDSGVSEVVFKGFQRNKEKLASEAVRRFGAGPLVASEATWESISEQVASISGEVGMRDRMPDLGNTIILEESEIRDLQTTVASATKGELSDFINGIANEDWVNSGREFLEDAEGCCPFCQRLLPPGFEQKLQEHFASGFDLQLQRARDIHQSASTKIAELKRNLSAMRDYLSRDPSADAASFNLLIDAADSICEVIRGRLEEKCAHPMAGVELPDTKDVLQALQTAVDELNEQIDSHNRLVADRKAAKEKIVQDGWELFLSDKRVSGPLRRFNGIKEKKEQKIQELRQKIELSRSRDRYDEDKIIQLRNRVSNTSEVAERINRTLVALGFHRFRIEPEDSVTGGYRIVRADGTLAHETMSEGEKSFLCFVYFWESLFGARESGVDPEDVVAVFDDPISSLDSETLFLVAAHIRQAAKWAIDEANNLRQLIVLTHNTQFHHEAAYETDRSGKEHRRYFRLIKGANGVTTLKDDGNVCKIRGSYPLLWDSVVEAARTDEESSLVQVGIFNIVRRIVEGYFKTIGQVQSYQRPKGLKVDEERVIMMFHMWASSGSHTIADDIDQTVDIGGTQRFLQLFRRYFDIQGHSAHFDMMLRASDGSELSAPGRIFESTEVATRTDP